MTDTFATSFRSGLAGDLAREDAGREIRLVGWVHRRRDLGGLVFGAAVAGVHEEHAVAHDLEVLAAAPQDQLTARRHHPVDDVGRVGVVHRDAGVRPASSAGRR